MTVFAIQLLSSPAASASGDSSGAETASSGSHKDYTRQKEYLEKTIESLKRSLKKDAETHRLGNMRIMGEQVELIREINELRKEIAYLKQSQAAGTA